MNRKLFMKVDKVTTKIEQEANRLYKRFSVVVGVTVVIGAIHLSNMSLAWLQSKEVRPMYVISLKDQSITFQTPLRDRTEDDKRLKSPIPQVQAQETKQIAIPTPSPTVATKKESDEKIAAYIKSKAWDYHIAIRVAKSENFWNLTKSFDCSRTHKNGDGSLDIGIFQINSIHVDRFDLEKLKDCYYNIDAAFILEQEQGWHIWSAFSNGSYLNHTEFVK